MCTGYICSHTKCNILQLLRRVESFDVTTNEMVEPLYQFQEAESFSCTPEVLDALKSLGYDSFRMKQEECIIRILLGKIRTSYVQFYV